ncbi:phage tail protein, partial [Photorhabdus cinerea]|nr:phage tail protein [Photorhabdus cinerea]
VPFSRVPNNIRAPLFYVEFDNSMANSAIATQRTLIIGQVLSTSTAKPDIPERISSAAQAANLYGNGSMLHGMTEAYFANDQAAEIWVLPLSDTDSMVAAKGSVKVSSPATDTGVISLYIGGQRVQITTVATDKAEQVATALSDAINKKVTLPVTATVAFDSADTVTLTAKNKGAAGNSIDLRLNYRGQSGGEFTPAGMALKIT